MFNCCKKEREKIEELKRQINKLKRDIEWKEEEEKEREKREEQNNLDLYNYHNENQKDKVRVWKSAALIAARHRADLKPSDIVEFANTIADGYAEKFGLRNPYEF